MSGSARCRSRSAARPHPVRKSASKPEEPKAGSHRRPVGEEHHQHQPEPVTRQRKEGHAHDRQHGIECAAAHRLHHADGDAGQIAEHERDADQPHGGRPGLGEHAANRPAGGDAGAPVARGEASEPCGVLRRERAVEANGLALCGELFGGGGRADEEQGGIAGGKPQQEEHQRDDAEDDAEAAERAPGEQRHGCNLPHRAATPVTTGRAAARYLTPCPVVRLTAGALLPPLILAAACQPSAARRGATVLFASGADLQSINPLLTLHPLARQVQRYVLLTTLARYDSALLPQPYLARRWAGATAGALTHRSDRDPMARWRADDVARRAWTLDAARNPATGYPSAAELASRLCEDRTIPPRPPVLRPPGPFPDVLTDLAILPAHRFDSVPPPGSAQAAWNTLPVGNGPFRFVAHEPNRRWVFAANPDFPAALGGPPGLDRFIVVVVDEPTTKLAALTSGELDLAGIQPAHAQFVARDPTLAVVTYPLLSPTDRLQHAPRPVRPPRRAPRASSASTAGRSWTATSTDSARRPHGPVPPDVPGYLPVAAATRVGARAAPRTPVAVRAAHRRKRRGGARADGPGAARRAGFEVRSASSSCPRFSRGSMGRRTTSMPRCSASPAIRARLPGPAGRAGRRDPAADAAAAQRLFAESVPVAFLYHARGLQGMNRRVPGYDGSPRRAAHGARVAGHAVTTPPSRGRAGQARFRRRLDRRAPFSAREGGAVVAAAIALSRMPRSAGGADFVSSPKISAKSSTSGTAALVPERAAALLGAARLLPVGPCTVTTVRMRPRLRAGQLGRARRGARGGARGRARRRLRPRGDRRSGLPARGSEAGIAGGRQDQFAATYGGFLRLTFRDPEVDGRVAAPRSRVRRRAGAAG